MRKLVVAFLVSGVFVSGAVAALDYDWFFGGNMRDDANIMALGESEPQPNWLIQMYEWDGTTPLGSIQFDLSGNPVGGAGGSMLPNNSHFTEGTAGAYVTFYVSPGPAAGDCAGRDVYTVMFNGDFESEAAPTHAIIFDESPFPMPSDGGLNYAFGGVCNGTWMPLVPEPSTIALFALGLVTVFAARRRLRVG